MLDIEKTPNGHRLLDVIRIIAFHGESGRLQMTVRSTEGTFFFRHGKLVDASIGSLTGFQAINAAVSMGEAHFRFDPSIPSPPLSSITHSERTILKQFFSIETLDPECHHHVAVSEPDWDIAPTQVVPLTDAAVSEFSPDKPESPDSPDSPDSIATVEAFPSADELHGGVKEEDGLEENAERPIVEPASEVWKNVPYGLLSSTSRQRSALYITIVFVLMAVGVVALVRKSGQPSSQIAARQSDSSVSTQSAVKPDESKSTETSVAKPSGPLVSIPEQQSKQIEQASSAAQDLTGKWTVVNTVEQTSYRSFKNLEIGFRLAINQTGKKFTAKGEKVTENGRTLPAGNRTPIHVTGSINGDRIEATFFEEGMLRKTNGRFVWRIVKTGSGLAGTFVSSAARTRGKSAATREL